MKSSLKPPLLSVTLALTIALTSCGRVGYEQLSIEPDSTSTVDVEKNTDSQSATTPSDSETTSKPDPGTDSGTNEQVGTDSGTNDQAGTDSELDLCPGDDQKTDPGVCGCGVPDADADSNGTPDCMDDPRISSFDFLGSQNDALMSDVAGQVLESRIYLTVPNGTNLSGLVPDIAFHGLFVSPAGGAAVDFSDSPVVYTVTGVNSQTKDYDVWVFSQSDNFDDNEGFDYSGWTEINFTNGALPLYVEQNGRLEWSRGEVGEEDHVTLNDSSSHSKSMTVSVFAAELDYVGLHAVYFFFQDENNWYRLRRDSGQGGIGYFEKRIDGATTAISSTAPLNLGTWVIEVTASGTISLLSAGATILSFSDTLSLEGGLIGLGGASRRPVWDDFKVSK